MADTFNSELIDYSKKKILAPRYALNRLPPDIAPTSTQITSSGGASDTIFSIPIGVMNLAQSRLDFDVTPLAGAGTNWMAADVLPYFRQVQLLTRGGVILANIDSVPEYTKVVWKPESKISDVLQNPICKDSSAAFNGLYEGLNCINSAGSADGADSRYSAVASDRPYLECRSLMAGVSGTASPYVHVSIPLKRFHNTLLEMNKDIYFGEIVQLKFIWSTNIKVVIGSRITDTNIGALTAYAGTIGISSMNLYIACEKNEEISKRIIAECESGGLSYLTNYVYTVQLPAAATAVSLQVRLNGSHGLTLKKIYVGSFPQSPAGQTTYDASRQVTTGFYTMLNNNRLLGYDLNCSSNNDDYREMYPLLKGSCILSNAIYTYNWVWCESFMEGKKPLCLKEDENNVVEGVPLSTEQLYTLSSTFGSAVNVYFFPVCQRIVSINKAGIIIN